MSEATHVGGPWRITSDWLQEHDACLEVRQVAAGRTLTVTEAVALALDAGRDDWAEWVLAHVLRDVPLAEIVCFACRRARSVPQGSAGEAAIALAERWAHGDVSVTVGALRGAAKAARAAAWAAEAAAADAQALADRYLGAASAAGE